MSTSPNDCGCVHQVSEGGISGRHPTVDLPTVHVGPSTDSEFNTVRAGLIPVACWRVEDIRFEFDSSLVQPGIETELMYLAQLFEAHPPPSKARAKTPPEPLGCPLSIFGHADPVGDDDYNKQLSGRRAKAIYALLTRRTELWEELFNQPFGRDKWGRRALEMMLDFVSTESEEIPGYQNSPASTKGAQGQQQSGNGRSAASGQTSQEQVVQYERDVGKRKQLFLKYMEKLCGADLKLEKGDFLARGEDAGGKGDFQGCSEFNPVLIFSQEDQKKFEQDKDKTARNNVNASNRRVMVLIFRKGSRVNPSKWPCPRVNEGVAGCKKRFWSDGEKRRSLRLPHKHRECEKANGTFACRFYDRMVRASPCERAKSRPARKYFVYVPKMLRQKIKLAISEPSGSHVRTVSVASAPLDEAGFSAFDLSDLDPAKTYVLQLFASERLLHVGLAANLPALEGFSVSRSEEEGRSMAVASPPTAGSAMRG